MIQRSAHTAQPTFDVPAPRLHAVTDINDRGQIVGYVDESFTSGSGFLRDPDGTITRIAVPGHRWHGLPHLCRGVARAARSARTPRASHGSAPASTYANSWLATRLPVG
jgi:hypothetical protein